MAPPAGVLVLPPAGEVLVLPPAGEVLVLPPAGEEVRPPFVEEFVVKLDVNVWVEFAPKIVSKIEMIYLIKVDFF